MAIKDIITSEVNDTLSISWEERNGVVIPDTSDIALKNGAVKLDATFLYADLAGSTILARLCPWQTTAKIIRSYLDTAVRLIRHHGGEVRSFDGDRVMGIFIGGSKNTNAVKCARNIDWVVYNLINPTARHKFESIKKNNITIKHCVGVHNSIARAVRTGIRNHNDLIWIGEAPSFAAKLSDVRNHPYEVYISKECYDSMNVSVKMKGSENIWVRTTVEIAGEMRTVYKTDTTLEP